MDYCLLYHGNEVVSAQLSFDFNNTRYLFAQGFNDKYEEISPGILIILNRIRDSCLKNMSDINIAIGDEDYKHHYFTHIHIIVYSAFYKDIEICKKLIEKEEKTRKRIIDFENLRG